jgi:hypothetical protein
MTIPHPGQFPRYAPSQAYRKCESSQQENIANRIMKLLDKILITSTLLKNPKDLLPATGFRHVLTVFVDGTLTPSSGAKLLVFGSETSRVVDSVPPIYRAIRHVSRKRFL